MDGYDREGKVAIGMGREVDIPSESKGTEHLTLSPLVPVDPGQCGIVDQLLSAFHLPQHRRIDEFLEQHLVLPYQGDDQIHLSFGHPVVVIGRKDPSCCPAGLRPHASHVFASVDRHASLGTDAMTGLDGRECLAERFNSVRILEQVCSDQDIAAREKFVGRRTFRAHEIGERVDKSAGGIRGVRDEKLSFAQRQFLPLFVHAGVFFMWSRNGGAGSSAVKYECEASELLRGEGANLWRDRLAFTKGRLVLFGPLAVPSASISLGRAAQLAISFRGHEAGPDSPTAGRAGAGDVSASGGVVVACPATFGGRDMALEHWKVEEARAPVCFDRSLSAKAITDTRRMDMYNG